MSLSGVRLIIIIVVILLGMVGTLSAQLELEIEIADAMGLPGDAGIPVTIYIKNFADSVAGFELWFNMDRPDIATFDIKVDTTGCLISDWDYIDVRSVQGGDNYDIKVTGLADIEPPFTKRGFPPQDIGLPLFRLSGSIFPEPDPYSGPTTAISVSTSMIDNFGFTTPQGQALGVSVEEIKDTSYFVCTQWAEPPLDSCLSWQQVPFPPYDSMHIETHYVGYVDSNKINFVDGSLTVAPVVCGNIDGSTDEVITGADLSLLIDHLLVSLNPLELMLLANVDGSTGGEVDGIDLTWMISTLFIDFRELECIVVK